MGPGGRGNGKGGRGDWRFFLPVDYWVDGKVTNCNEKMAYGKQRRLPCLLDILSLRCEWNICAQMPSLSG